MTKICDHGHGHGGAFAPQQPMNALGIVKRPVDYLRDYPDSCRRRLATKLNFRPPNFALRADLASQLNGASGAALRRGGAPSSTGRQLPKTISAAALPFLAMVLGPI